MIRYAIVRNARDRQHAETYLPGNYSVVGEVYEQQNSWSCVAPGGKVPDGEPKIVYVIEGRDVAGWTLGGYVIPRYASGLIWAEEVDLSHPVMKQVPA